MNKPKVLVFIDWYLPGTNSGGPVMSVHGIVSKLENYFDFYIVTRNNDYQSKVPYPDIPIKKWINIEKSKVYYIPETEITRNLFRTIEKEVSPDVIYLNSFFSNLFSLQVLKIFKSQKIILAPRGMLSKGSLSVKPVKKRLFLFYAKIIGLYNNVIFHASSEQEKKDIQFHFPNNEIRVALNLRVSNNVFYAKNKEVGSLKMVFAGRIAPEKNLKYAIEALQFVNNGKIELKICGSLYAHEYWQDCQAVIDSLPPHIKVNYGGELKKNELNKVFADAHVIFLPSTGENFGHAILEGMELGCIPLISDRTPWRDFESRKIGFDLSLDKQKLFSEKIEYLCGLSQKEFDVYSHNAKNFSLEVSNDSENIELNLSLFT